VILSRRCAKSRGRKFRKRAILWKEEQERGKRGRPCSVEQIGRTSKKEEVEGNKQDLTSVTQGGRGSSKKKKEKRNGLS